MHVNQLTVRDEGLLRPRMSLKDSAGVKAVPVYSMVKEAVVYANALSFFGRDLGKMISHVTVSSCGSDTRY